MGIEKLIGKKKGPEKEEAPPKLEELRFQSADAAEKLFVRHFGAETTPEEQEAVHNILYSFFREEISAARPFHSKERPGVSFAYTPVNVRRVAEKLYEQYTGEKAPEVVQESNETTRSRKEFIFASIIGVENPSAPFVFFEQALHRVVLKLDAALEAVKNGKEFNDEVYLLQAPFSEMGTITPEFLEDSKNNKAFEELGTLYAELATAEIEKTPDKERQTLVLHGISMGACQAIETAQKLLEEGHVAQNREAADAAGIPFMQVRIDTPPGQDNHSWLRRRIQVPAGFAAHGAEALTRNITKDGINSYDIVTSSPRGHFTKDALPFLKENGIEVHASEEETKQKKEGIKAILDNLYAGVPIPDDLKVIEVVGTDDLTMYAPFSAEKRELEEKLADQKEAHGGSLGENVVSKDRNSNRRTFAAQMGHQLPNFYENEMRRLQSAAQALLNYKK